ncbi:MAG: gliding motility-associated C-terminal domain-containing protein, partial [bacterium]|nr:gliding motility-associated C-terminal domain-containing protein [bacterium]
DSIGKFNPLIAGVSTKKVFYTFVDSRGCKNTDSITVRIDSIPNAKIQAAGPFCMNAGIKQISHASNIGGKYSGGTYIDSVGKFNPNIAGVSTKKVYYTFVDSRGCKNTDSISVRIDSVPSAKIAPAGPFCKNAGIKQMSHASNAGGKYSGGAYIDSIGKFNPNIAGVSTKKVYYTFVDSRGCKNTDSIAVRIDSIPSAKIATAGPLCKNAGIKQMSHASNAGGKYSGGTYIDSIGKFNPNIAGVNSHKIYYTFKDSRGCSNTDSISVQVDSIPSAKIQLAGPFCKNEGIKQINHASNAGGKFSGGLYIDSVGQFNPSIANVGLKKVFYTFKDSRGCSNTDSIAVKIDSVPSAKIAAAGPFCKNAGIQQMGHASNAGGKYSGGLYIDSVGKFNPNIAGVNTHKVYYTFIDSRGCKNTDSVNVRVDSIPSAKIQASGPFCKNAGIQQINHASNPGGKFSGGLYINLVGQFNPNIAGVSNHKVYYTFKDSRGCSNTDSINVRVDSIPNASIQPAGPFCENAAIQQLKPKFNAGGYFTPKIGLDSFGNLQPLLAKAGTHKVYYTFKDASGCSNKDSINIIIDNIPDARIIQAGPYCSADVVQQINPVANGGVFSGGLFIDALGKFDPSKAVVGFNMVKYQLTNSSNCAAKDSVLIEVIQSPNNTIIYSPDKGCDPLLVKFETQAAFKIIWTLNSKTSNQQKDSALLTANSYVLQLDVENVRGCKQQLKENIKVYPLPVANFNFTPTKVYINDPQVFFNDNSIGNVTGWNWYFGDNDSSKIQDPGHDYQKAGTYKVELYIVDKNGCLDSTSRIVTVLDDFICFIPDVITPNGDGHNEVFNVVGMGIKNVACQIFNRWGEQLYSNDQFVTWDGTYQNEIVQDGVYLYMLQIKDNKGGMHYLKGEITVLR